MQLTSLHLDGLKRRKGAQLNIPKLLAVQGPNGSGKTSLRNGINLGTVGYDPEMGKRLADTRRLAGGKGDIQVRLGFDTGFGIRRSFGRAMHTETLPPRGETTEKEHQARIDEETGSFTMSFDLESYMERSDEKQKEALFAMLPRELLGTWGRDLFRTWLGYTEAADNFKAAIDKLWIEQVETAQSPVEGLASALSFIKDRFLEADRDRQAQEKVSAAASAEAEAAAAARAAVEGEDGLDALQLDLSIVDRRLGELREKKEAVAAAIRRHGEADDRMKLVVARIEQGEAFVAEMKERLASLSVPKPEQRKKAAEALAVSADEQRFARQELSTASADLRTAAKRLEAAEEELAKLEHLESCPFCGSEETLEAVRTRVQETATQAAEEVQSLGAIAKEAEAAARKAEERYESVESANRVLQGSVERLDKVTRELHQAESLLEGVRREKQALEDRGIAPPDEKPESFDSDIDDLECQASELRSRIKQIQDQAESVGRAKGALERADRELQEYDRRKARAGGLKDLLAGLKKLRGHVIQQMVAPVEVVANELLQEIDPEKRFGFVFERENKDVFDLGFEEAGVFRGYAEASSGEKAFLAVVFVAALIAAIRPKWRVLLVDNAEKIDAQRRRNLMEALARVADRFDNVILCACADFEPVEGWEILDAATLQPAETVELAGAAA